VASNLMPLTQENIDSYMAQAKKTMKNTQANINNTQPEGQGDGKQ